jgi:hypothetical protein
MNMQPPYQQPPYQPYPPQNQQPYQQFHNQTQPKKRNYKKVLTILLVIVFISVIFTIEIVHGVLTPSCTVGIPETTAKLTMARGIPISFSAGPISRGQRSTLRPA